MGFHLELGIRNYTAEQLIVMLPNGSTYKVDPISQYADANPRVHVESIIRDHYNHIYDCTKNGKSSQLIATITQDVLFNGPVALTEFNLVVCFSRYSHLLPQYNVFNREYYNHKLEQDIRRYWSEPGFSSPIFIVGNSHNVAQQALYMIVNNTILQYKIVHDFTRDESLDIFIQAYNGWRKLELPDLKWDKLNTQVQPIGDTEWMVSTNYEILNKYLQDKRAKESAKMSKEDADAYIESKTASYREEIEDLKRQVANLLREIDYLKRSLANSENELRAANMGARRSYEQELYRQKGRNLRDETDLLREKRHWAREQDDISERQRYLKAESDLDLARAKIEKEKYGLAATEASNMATYAKTAAVLVPAIIGAGMWAAKALSNAHPALAAAGMGTRVLMDHGASIMSVVKNTGNTVSCLAKKIWSLF